jgi:hypothetical protein
MRYVLGPSVASVGLTTVPPTPEPAPAPAALIDVECTIESAGDSGVVIVVPPYDPGSHQAPAEFKVFLAPEGSTFPSDVHGWLSSAFAVSTLDAAPVPAGESVTVPVPVVAPGAYFLQTVLGFSV